MRGFGASLGPWLWFKLYWAAWALLLAVAATLLWVRGTERSVRSRLQSARLRFTRPAAVVAATAVTLILSVGGFIFYNTNVLHAYVTAADRLKRSADYERRYGQYSQDRAATARRDGTAHRDLSRAAGGGGPRHLSPCERQCRGD